MNVIKVQDCGCIAISEELAAATGLHPGATLSLEPAAFKSCLAIGTIEAKEAAPHVSSVQCKESKPANL
jgi:hypothetical protein